MFNYFKDRISRRSQASDLETESTADSSEIRLNELIEAKLMFPEPTEEDYSNLPEVVGNLPSFSYLLCLMEFSERASFYCVKNLLANFVQLPLSKNHSENAGALGMGLQAASGITMVFVFLAYLTPLFGGYISDKSWGRVKTIWYGVWLGGIAHIVLIFAAIPGVIEDHRRALAPLLISILILAFATGLIKPNLLPLLMDQYPHASDVIETRPDGSRVILSREKSLERITLIFYWAINIGSIVSIGTEFAAKRIGFWLAFLVPGIIYFTMVPILYLVAKKLKKETPAGLSVIQEANKVLKWSFHKGFTQRIKEDVFWQWAKPTNILARGEVESLEDVNKKGKKIITWTDQFVDDVRVTLSACVIFLFFIIYLVNDGGIGSIQNSQSTSMKTDGVPNTLFNNFNPLTIIILIPILNYGIYPMLRKFKINFLPVYRIFFGFMIAAVSQAVGAIIQWRIYQTSPCGYYATDCTIDNGEAPISAWYEIILYILQSSSECFANTSAFEIAYIRAPESMKGLVMAVFLSMSSLSAAISAACTPALEDPNLIWPFVACAIVGTLVAFLFLYVYRNLHKVMEQERIEKDHKRLIECISQRDDDSSSFDSISTTDLKEPEIAKSPAIL